MKKWSMIIDIEKCEDCNNCFLACKDEHVDNDWQGYSLSQPRHGHRWMNILRKERGQYPLMDVAYRPTPCMHCDDAPCVKVAEDGSVYKRDDGIVIIDPEKAAGRKDIIKSCPYGAVWWNEEKNIPQKCTMCAHLLDEGCLAQGLTGEACGGVFCRQMIVSGGIPEAVVHSVEDASQESTPLLQDTFHAHTVLRGLDLLCVSGAHRGDGLRVDDPCLEETDISPELHTFLVIKFLSRQTRQRKLVLGKGSLVSHIMDGKD